MLQPTFVVSRVVRPVWPGLLTETLQLVVGPLTLVLHVIGVPIRPVAITLVFLPLSLVGVAVGVDYSAVSMAFAPVPVPLVDGPIELVGDPVALLETSKPVADVYDSVGQLLLNERF